MAGRRGLAAELQAVEPTGVDLSVADLRPGEQIEQEADVGGAAIDDDRRLGQGAAQAGQGLAAVASPGDQLGDHRVELGRDRVAFGHPGVDPDPGAAREAQQRDPPGRRGEPQLRVLGVDPGLDRVADRRRGLPLEPAPGGDVELQLQQVEPGGRLGDRVLDLQAGVDLHEGEQPLLGLEEELDGRRAAVGGPQRQPHRRLAQHPLLLGGERRAARLLDDLLVASLHAAVADPDRPGGPLAVGDQLHLDVAGGIDQLLEQDGVVAEGVAGLRAGAAQRLLELIGAPRPGGSPALPRRPPP